MKQICKNCNHWILEDKAFGNCTVFNGTTIAGYGCMCWQARPIFAQIIEHFEAQKAIAKNGWYQEYQFNDAGNAYASIESYNPQHCEDFELEIPDFPFKDEGEDIDDQEDFIKICTTYINDEIKLPGVMLQLMFEFDENEVIISGIWEVKE